MYQKEKATWKGGFFT